MNDFLRPLRGRIDRRHIWATTIAVVGVGRVGAPVALELARLAPRHMILVDGDRYETRNRSGHPLPAKFVGQNKAEALATYLEQETPWVQVTAIPDHVDPNDEDDLLDTVIEPSTLLVVATDQLVIQRHVANLARTAEVPAIVPGVDEHGERCEAFLSLTEDQPCLTCVDGFRDAGSPVRGAALVGPDAYPAIALTFYLAVAVLDSDSPEADGLLSPLRRGGPLPQLFRAWPPGAPELAHADDGRAEVTWRAGCPGCGGPPPRAARRARLRAAGARQVAAVQEGLTPPPFGWALLWGALAVFGLLLIGVVSFGFLLLLLGVFGAGVGFGYLRWGLP